MFKQELQSYEREAYEQYIQAMIKDPSDKIALTQSLQKFVPGSDLYDYLYLITEQKTTNGKLSENALNLLKQFKDNRRHAWQDLTTRQKLLDFDNLQTDTDRINCLKEIIQDVIQYHIQHATKPFQQEHQGIAKQGEEVNEIQIMARKEATINPDLFKKDFQAEAKEGMKKVEKEDDYRKIQESQRFLNQMPLYMAHIMDFTIFHPNAIVLWACQNTQNVAGIINPSFLSQLKAGIAYQKKINEFCDVDRNLCNSLSLEQLNQLKSSMQSYTDPNIIGASFCKQYCEEMSVENQQIWNNNEKYENLLKLYNAAKSEKMPKSLIQMLQTCLLQLGPKVNKYDMTHFKSMLKYQEERYGGGTMTQQLTSALGSKLFESHKNFDWTSTIQNIIPEDAHSLDPHTIARKYLEEFAFQLNGNLSDFKNKNNKFLPLNQVEAIEDRIRIYLSQTGLQDLKLNKKISAEEFKRISDEVNLTFLPQNKDKFKVDEPVELWLEVKNVQTVHCKVFEFNTLTYYRKTMKPFDTSIDLDGLESTIVRKFEFNVPANCKRKEKFEFPELKGRIGLFIIEFVGNGRSARAVVKKGSLSLIHKSTIAGHEAIILDDNREVCKGQKTGIWLGNKFYTAKQDGKIFIEYSQRTQNTSLIMVHGDFAQLGEFTHKSEDYDFQCQFYLNEESVLVGSTAQILISPFLTINQRRANLSLLQNISATVRTEDFIDCIPTTQNFNNLKVQSNSDILISFQVPPNLKYIKVTLKCQVLNTTTKNLIDFSKEKQFNINTFEASTQVHDYHLKMVKDNKYELLVLGKNGEPKPFTPQSLNFIHAFNGSFSTKLTTDDQGKIYLGQLDQVLTVQVQGQGSRTWKLPNLKNDTWTYPQSIETVQGSSVEIPVANMWDSAKPDKLDRQQVTLTRSMHGIVIEDWFKKIKVIKKANAQSHYFLLQVENLESGEYNFYLRGEQNHHILIRVHNGEFLKNMENMILKKNCLQELAVSQKILKIKESSFENSELKIQLADFSQNARVHIVATHFLPNSCYNFLNSLQGMIKNQVSSSTFTFAKWTNLLLSDRQLSDEYRYVFDRDHLERQLGNSLDRPSLLNKRIFTRTTEIDKEVLNSGSSYAAIQEVKQDAYSPMMQNVMPRANERMMDFAQKSQRIQPSSSRSYMGGAPPQPNNNINIADYITDYQNFIRDAPFISLNLKPDENGVVILKQPNLAIYSTIQIIVVDDSQVMQSTKSINSSKELNKRDLSLKKSLNENKGLTEQRQHKCLVKDQSDFIEDITSSQVMIVDDLQKVNQILSEIQQLNGQPVDGNGGHWAKLTFVKRWSSLSNDQKNFFYGEYQCHELNYFIKKRDQVYFENVVRGFLSGKMEKTFVDLYLLDRDADLVKTFTQMSFKFQLLNAFEKCLLIQVLNRNGQRNLAERIFKNMKEIVQATNDQVIAYRVEFTNRIFDLVLNMNSTTKSSGSLHRAQVTATATTTINRQQQNQVAQLYFGGGGSQFGAAAGSKLELVVPRSLNQLDYEMEQCEDEGYGDLCFDDADFGGMESYSVQTNNIRSNLNMLNRQRQANFSQEKFQQLEAASEYMETFYYQTQLKGGQETQHLVEQNHFWCDFAEHILSGQSDFISLNFTECITPIQKFLCQVILDLPISTQASVHQTQADDSRGVTIKVGSNAIIFKKEIKEVEVEIQQDFMVTHRYQRIDDFGRTNKSDDDEAVPKEFLINVPYECEVIMTNVSPNNTEFNLLYQIPIGSMPIQKTKFMKSQPLKLESYSTEKFNFQFYFPKVGQFGHYPSNVSIGEKVTARGQFNTLNVVQRRKINKEDAAELNFDDLVQVASEDQMLEYLRTKNLLSSEKGFSFHKIMFMLQEKDFWTKTVKILRERQIYVRDVWAYACQHLDTIAIREFLMTEQSQGLTRLINGHFISKLFEKNPSTSYQNFYRMLEYNPMINSRAHSVGDTSARKILNKTFRETYDSFLQTVALKKELTFEEKMIFTYYLQLQDRIPEAIELFNKLDLPEAISENDVSTLELQHDYLSAYFDFFIGAEDGYKVARRIVQRYDNYPLSNWKMMFLAIEDQLNDFDGEFDQMQGDYDSESSYSGSEASMRLRKQENLKNSKSQEPSLSNTQIDEKGSITIETANIKTVVIKYYMIDAEILFSRAPFLKNNAEEFSYVKPCIQLDVKMLPDDVSEEEKTQFVTKVVQLPEKLKNKNLVIEINGEGKQEFKTFYSCELKVQINEAFGELKVMHGDKSVGKVYVKVFSQDKSGKESFYRDGYTDIRGKFEYATTSGDKLKQVQRFSILVQSEEFGSQIKEINPPKDEKIVSTANSTGNIEVPQVQSSMVQAKQDRILNRHNWVQSKKK